MSQYLSATTTLNDFTASVREQIGAVSQQKSQLLKLAMNDIIHQTLSDLRTILAPLVDDFYFTQKTDLTLAGTAGLLTASLAALTTGSPTITYSMHSIKRFSLRHATTGEIPRYDLDEFNARRDLYASGLTTADAFCTTLTTFAKPPVLTLQVLTASSVTSLTSVEIDFLRNVLNVTTGADTLDFPDTFIPLARNICTLYAQKKIRKEQSADIVSATKAQFDSLMAKIAAENQGN